MVETQKKFLKTSYQVKPGAVVMCKVDTRDVTHPRGIVGVVTKANETGAVKVMCEHRMLSHKGSSQWCIPSDKYKVIAKADEVANVSQELLATRKDIMSGQFVKKKQQTVSIQKAHQLTIGVSSLCKRTNCGCYKGKCNA